MARHCGPLEFVIDSVRHSWLNTYMSNTAAQLIASLAARFDAMPFTGWSAAGIPTKRIVKIVDGQRVELVQVDSETYWYATGLDGTSTCGMVAA